MERMNDSGAEKRIRSLDEFDREFFPKSAGRLPAPSSSTPLRIGARFIREAVPSIPSKNEDLGPSK